MDLSRATLEDLRRELTRREQCETKPKKNIIIIEIINEKPIR